MLSVLSLSFEPIQSYVDAKQPYSFGSPQYLNLISSDTISLGVCFPFCKFGKIIFHCRISMKILQDCFEDRFVNDFEAFSLVKMS